jgi:hypothetical protein
MLVELDEFALALEALTVDDIRAIAADLAALVSSPADEAAATKAVLVIEQSLHRLRRSAKAGHAAHACARAVIGVAERAGVALPDGDVTRVARSAATLSRGLVAGMAGAQSVQFLAGGWHRITGAAPEPVQLLAA